MFNSKVQKHSFGLSGLSDYSKMSEAYAAKEFMRSKMEEEKNNSIEKRIAVKEQMLSVKESSEKVVLNHITEGQKLNVYNKIYEDGKLILLNELLFEMYSKSLLLDDEVVIEKENAIRSTIESFVQSKGGFKLLEKAYNKHKTPLLKNMKEICESVAKKVSTRKMKDAEENKDLDINFELNDEEKEMFDYEKEKLSIEEISELVKKKVLTVIQDEKMRQQKESELLKDIEETDEVKENSFKVLNENRVEESTLFNTLLRDSYKNLLESMSARFDYTLSRMKDNDDYDINLTEEEASKSEFEGYDEVDEEYEEYISKNKETIDLDLVLAEGISRYTLMEMLYTTKLEDYTTDEIMKLTHFLLN